MKRVSVYWYAVILCHETLYVCTHNATEFLTIEFLHTFTPPPSPHGTEYFILVFLLFQSDILMPLRLQNSSSLSLSLVLMPRLLGSVCLCLYQRTYYFIFVVVAAVWKRWNTMHPSSFSVVSHGNFRFIWARGVCI